MFCWKKEKESSLKFSFAPSLLLVKKKILHKGVFELQLITEIFYIFLPHIWWSCMKLRTDDVTAIYCINMQRNMSPTWLKNCETLRWQYIPNDSSSVFIFLAVWCLFQMILGGSRVWIQEWAFTLIAESWWWMFLPRPTWNSLRVSFY